MNVVFETLTDYGNRFAIVQRYIPRSSPAATRASYWSTASRCRSRSRGFPSASDNRGNLAAGATGVTRPLDDRDRFLAGQIGPRLAEQGMLFVGLDVIGGFVTEINVTSPTGIREIDKQRGTDVGGLLMEAIARRLQARA